MFKYLWIVILIFIGLIFIAYTGYCIYDAIMHNNLLEKYTNEWYKNPREIISFIKEIVMYQYYWHDFVFGAWIFLFMVTCTVLIIASLVVFFKDKLG